MCIRDSVKGYSTFGEANRGTVAQMAYNALFAEAPRFGTYTAKEGDATTTETKLLIMGAFGVSYEYSILELSLIHIWGILRSFLGVAVLAAGGLAVRPGTLWPDGFFINLHTHACEDL